MHHSMIKILSAHNVNECFESFFYSYTEIQSNPVMSSTLLVVKSKFSWFQTVFLWLSLTVLFYIVSKTTRVTVTICNFTLRKVYICKLKCEAIFTRLDPNRKVLLASRYLAKYLLSPVAEGGLIWQSQFVQNKKDAKFIVRRICSAKLHTSKKIDF